MVVSVQLQGWGFGRRHQLFEMPPSPPLASGSPPAPTLAGAGGLGGPPGAGWS